MRVEFKETIWYTVEVDEKDSAEVLSKLKSGEISCASEIFDDYQCWGEHILESGEQLPPEQNCGYQTILAIDDDGIELFSNGK